MTPTEEQLNNIEYWDTEAPEGAMLYDELYWVKWEEGRQYSWRYTRGRWMPESTSISPENYENIGIFHPVIQYKCFKEVEDVIGFEAAFKELKLVHNIENTDEALASAFVWGASRQGDKFWNDISRGIKPQEYRNSEAAKHKKESSVAAETLKAALSHMDDRATTYDNESGERSMSKTVSMFNTMYGAELSEEQGWAFMCILKLVRTSQGDFRADNYEDLAAYAGLMCEGADNDQ